MTDLETYRASFEGDPGYLNWAAFGPVSPAVRAESHADAELLGSGRRSSIQLVDDHCREATEHLGALLGTDADHVSLQPSTTYGLMHAVYGLSGGLVLSRAEFPALTVAATRASAALRVLDVQWVEPADGFMTPDVVAAALTDETRAVAVSLVDFRTGFRADLGALRDVIGDRLLIVDAIQGFGVVDADYAAADVVAANGYKWLRAGRGTGFVSFSDRALERLAPVLSGYAGVDGDLPLDTVPSPAPGAAAFGAGSIDSLAAARLAAAAEEIRAVGVAVIEGALAERTAEIIDIVDRHAIAVETPRESSMRAGIISLVPPAAEVAPLAAALENQGLTVTVRGGRVRLAPHVGTDAGTLRDVDDALGAFDAMRAR